MLPRGQLSQVMVKNVTIIYWYTVNWDVSPKEYVSFTWTVIVLEKGAFQSLKRDIKLKKHCLINSSLCSAKIICMYPEIYLPSLKPVTDCSSTQHASCRDVDRFHFQATVFSSISYWTSPGSFSPSSSVWCMNTKHDPALTWLSLESLCLMPGYLSYLQPFSPPLRKVMGGDRLA
jgi:hypothetical protein